MNAVSRSMTIWLLTVLAPANIHAASTADDERRAVVRVVVHNYAAVPQAILDRAIHKVTRVYEGLGIDVRWVEPMRQPNRPCAVPADRGSDGRARSRLPM